MGWRFEDLVLGYQYVHSIVTSVRRLLNQPSSKFSKLSIEGAASPEGATPRNVPACER